MKKVFPAVHYFYNWHNWPTEQAMKALSFTLLDIKSSTFALVASGNEYRNLSSRRRSELCYTTTWKKEEKNRRSVAYLWLKGPWTSCRDFAFLLKNCFQRQSSLRVVWICGLCVDGIIFFKDDADRNVTGNTVWKQFVFFGKLVIFFKVVFLCRHFEKILILNVI